MSNISTFKPSTANATDSASSSSERCLSSTLQSASLSASLSTALSASLSTAMTPGRPAAVTAILRCQALGMHTDSPGKISRSYLSKSTIDAHRDISGWMQAAGLSVRTDAAGNLIGRFASPNPDAPVLLIGSHLDTIPDAGKFDGILGVMIGLAVVEAIGKTSPLPFHIDVVGFSEEEGVRFSRPYLGSAAIAGVFSPQWLKQVDADGIKLRDAIEAFGLDPSQIDAAVYDENKVIGFIEPHIEQGPVLLDTDSPLGVVDVIVGQSRAVLRFLGHPGHAGTTPMHCRRDALVAASRWIARVSDRAKMVEGIRATVGSLKVSPGAGNVIPGRVDVSIDIRHRDDQSRCDFRDEMLAEAREFAKAEGVRLDIFDRHEQSAVMMDSSLGQQLSSAITSAGHASKTMVSGAGHDAVIMSAKFPSTMLFIRQKDGGISHHPDEDVDVDDVAAGIDATIRFVKSLTV